MDIAPVSTITIPRTCGAVPCGQCQPCRRRAMLNMASYALREEAEEGGQKAALSELLEALGLRG